MMFLDFSNLEYKIKQRNIYKASAASVSSSTGRVSNTQECQTHQQSYNVSTRMYKGQLEGSLIYTRYVRHKSVDEIK